MKNILHRIENHAVPSLLNEINSIKIIRMMWFDSPLSRADISRRSGLSKPTTSRIVELLTDKDLLEPTGDFIGSSAGGKKAQLYRFNPNAGYILVCDVQETYIDGVISNCKGSFTSRFKIDITNETPPNQAVELAISEFRKLLTLSNISYDRLLGVGISIPGVIDFEEGIVVHAPGLPKWNDFPIREPFIKEFDTAVYVENENRLMAVAEYWFGAAMDVSDFISISMGESTGTGSAICIDGNLRRGINNIAGEIGHIQIVVNSSAGGERYEKMNSHLAVWSFLNRTREILKEYPQSKLKQILEHETELKVEDVFCYADQGDTAARMAVAELGEWMGLMIGNLLLTIDLPLVVINGPYRKGGDLLMNLIRDTLKRNYFPQMMKRTRIVYSGISEDIRKIGAMSLVIQHHFSYLLD